MKFARYLAKTQVPEWKNAYIDYNGLKKIIEALHLGQNETEQQTDEVDRSPLIFVHLHGSESDDTHEDSTNIPIGRKPALQSSSHRRLGHSQESNGEDLEQGSSSNDAVSARVPRRINESVGVTMPGAFDRRSAILGSSRDDTSEKRSVLPSGFFMRLRRTSKQLAQSFVGRGTHTEPPQPLSVVLTTLPAHHQQFIEKLDKDLEKVRDFYAARETEAIAREGILKKQLEDLHSHRLVSEAKADDNWTKTLARNVADRLSDLSHSHISKKRRSNATVNGETNPYTADSAVGPDGPEKYKSILRNRTVVNSPGKYDPDEYKRARRNLKKAVLEYYRGLELLNDYRVLNITGFRKILKKYERNFNFPLQRPYMEEKVETSIFTDGSIIDRMKTEMQLLFAAHFVHGDVRKARARLHATQKISERHFSTFRIGLYIGLALPLFIDGVIKSFSPEVRETVPWGALLLAYGTLIVPVLFAFLIGINTHIWHRQRINYQFIFELDVRHQIDRRLICDFPAFLLLLLCSAFWLSFSRIWEDAVRPTTWPLVWIVSAVALLFNPFPLFHVRSRYWFIRKTGKLLVSGAFPVEFVDFWLGDQFCSLTFTLSNFYFIGCAYVVRWDDALNRCSAAEHWGIPFTLASLPFIVRAVQSVKRYVDSGLDMHLVNACKYLTSIVTYLFYYLWRHNNRKYDWSFAMFIVSGTASSIYSFLWDVRKDWSFFTPAAKLPLLRPNLMYNNYPSAYYIALILNALLRFSWLLYTPDGWQLNFSLRTFITAILEMFRRWVWNFLRLENEHIGNTDQYRATREVPLPYHADNEVNDSDDEGEPTEKKKVTIKNEWVTRNSLQ